MTKQIPDWARRLIEERETLHNNRVKLYAAIEANSVPESEVAILIEQWECMVHLETILDERIRRFTGASK